MKVGIRDSGRVKQEARRKATDSLNFEARIEKHPLRWVFRLLWFYGFIR